MISASMCVRWYRERMLIGVTDARGGRGFGCCWLGALGGEERFGVEGRLLAADAGEVELVAAHGDADAAFDAGGELGEEVAAVERGGCRCGRGGRPSRSERGLRSRRRW